MTRDTEVAPLSPHSTAGSARLPEPRLLGRYRLVSKKGAGLFGTVWLAEEAATGQPVALRLLPRELTDTANVAEMIRRRARAIVEASRAHPGLVRVLEYGSAEDGQLFAVMERVEGWLLSEMLASRQRLDLSSALRLAVELGGPVETLHNMGLVHGAIRPRNFVVANGRAVLMDVETIALRDAAALQPLVAAQSPAAYLAPEQVQARPITEKTDVYAFAVTLYEMLTSVPPFAAPTREAALDKQLRMVPVLPRRRRRAIPAAVEATIMEALAKRPEQRPFVPTVLDHIATEAGSDIPRWKRAAAIAGGLVLVAALGATIAWSVVGSRLSPPAVLAPAPEETPAEPNTEPATVTSAPPPAAEQPAAPESADPLPPTVAEPPAIEPPPRVVATPPSDVASPAVVAPPPIVTPPPVGTLPPIAAPSTLTPPPGPRTAAPRPLQVAPAPQAERPLPTSPAAARPAPSPGADEPDPAAVIDWLLKRRGE